MERLTNSIDYCQLNCDFWKEKECFFQEKLKCYEKNIYEKLRDYENAEEQGLLLKLPCKVGDTVYQVNHLRKCVSSFKVKAVSVTAFGFWIEWELLEGMYINLNGFNSEEIGKTVFLTKEEAEQALKQMGE